MVDFGLLQLTSGVQPQMGPGFSRGASGDGSASRRMTGPGVGPWSQEELRDLEPGMKRSGETQPSATGVLGDSMKVSASSRAGKLQRCEKVHEFEVCWGQVSSFYCTRGLVDLEQMQWSGCK